MATIDDLNNSVVALTDAATDLIIANDAERINQAILDAQAQADIATTQAGLATTNGAAQVTLATDQANIATSQAVSAAASALIADPDKAYATLMRPPTQAIATTYAASGSTGIQIANNDNLNFGTGDFTLCWTGSLPDWTPAAIARLIYKWQAATDRLNLYVNTTGTIGIIIAQTGGTSLGAETTLIPSLADNSQHTISAVIKRETATVAGEASFFVDGVLLGNPIVITAGVKANASNTGVSWIMGDAGGVRQAATTHSAHAYNRALSAAEVLSYYRYGIAESDKWGSQTELVYGTSSTLMVKADWTWGGEDATHILTDTAGGIRYQSDTTAPTMYLMSKGPLPIVGRKYRVIVKISSFTSGAIKSDNFVGLSVASAGTHTFELVCGYHSAFNFTRSTTNVDMVVESVSIKLIGATLALEPEGIQPAPGQWLDSSTNKLHAMQPATGSSLTRKKESFEVRWTNTWAGTSETQYIAGLNQAVLPPNCYIESIVAVVSGVSPQNIIVGDGSDADRWVTLTTGITAGTQTLALANRVSDGTNRKMTVAPSAIATMSISWVIKGMIL